MYCSYQDREALEDELYQEEDSEGSEVNSELEFHLYSQLHYCSNTGEKETLDDDGEGEMLCRVKGKDVDQSRPIGCDTVGLQRLLMVPELKRDRLKAKGVSKGSRPRPGPLEEVIVIDSGTDAITVSDDDMDCGVCAFKGGKSKVGPLQSSTPAPQKTQKRKRSPSLDSVVIVNSDSDSGPDSEEPDLDSVSDSDVNSDALENWMILGRGERTEDLSISLNLEGQSHSDTDVDEGQEGSWLVSSKDMVARIYNKDKGARPLARRDSNRYYQDKNVTCRSCQKTGHLSKNCPSPNKVSSCLLCGMPGHHAKSCPNRHCNNCGLAGHMYESCNEKSYWYKQCHRCGMTGHFFDVCPEIWRQYHITIKTGLPKRLKVEDLGRTPPYCYNCSKKGHFGHACTQRRMYNGVYPSTPFINYYDTPMDFKRREHRIKKKVVALQESGLLPDSCEAPVTPGPPKKKQKTTHHQKNKPATPKSHQTPKKHKATPVHIRFSDKGKRLPTANLKPAANLKPTKANKQTQHSAGPASKGWKPKRPVPASRDPPPPPKPAKIVSRDDQDFPRGGGREDKAATVGRKKKVKNGKNVKFLADLRKSPFRQEAFTPEQLFGPGVAWRGEKGKKNRPRGRGRKAAAAADMYPTDENLFAIKQRKRKR